MIYVDKINRSGNLAEKLCRDGSVVNKAYRSGELIYQRIENVNYDYSEYLTFDIISGGTIVWLLNGSNVTPLSIDYKLNNGEWTTITADTGSSAPSINVVNGDSIKFRGDNSKYVVGWTNDYHTFKGSTAYFNIRGNIMSLISKNNFATLSSFTETSVFSNLFEYTNVVSAENLLLPTMILTNNCYNQMFKGCTHLLISPTLPALTANIGSLGCYQQMFYNCSNLSRVKCLATEVASVATANWLTGVAENGTFIKNKDMDDWEVGDWGIPSGWKVIDAT